jgi:hypothetical protein
MESSKRDELCLGRIYLTGEISRRVGLMIGVCLNDVRVARGVIACLLPMTLSVALYKDLTE